MWPPPAFALSNGHGRMHTAAMPLVNAGFHRPGVVTRTGAGMLLLHMPARGMGGVSGKPPPTTPHSDHAAKGEGVTLYQPRFAAPHRKVMDVDLVAGFTRRAQDITASCANPQGGRFFARHTCFAQDAVMLHTTT